MPRISEAKKADRRAQVLDAARACFLRAGIHQTSMRDIIEESGLSAGAIYNYFKSKDDLIVAMTQARREREDERVAELERQETAPLEELLSLSEYFFRALEAPGDEDDRKMNLLTWAEGVHNRQIHELTSRGFANPNDHITELFEALERRGSLPEAVNARAISSLVTAAYHGYVLQRLWHVAPPVDDYLAALRALVTSAISQERSKTTKKRSVS